MKPEAQRIEIAKECGWEAAIQITKNCWVACKDGSPLKPIPHYTEDLNAMHEAESTLSNEGMGDYQLNLMDVQERQAAVEMKDYWLIHATAAQRAEAFLRTIGKWTDD